MVSVKTIRKIKDFGTYKNFNGYQPQIPEFSKINIFYGRNYSGKTTLSRIFRACELGKMPSNYDSSEFTLQMQDGKPDILHSNLSNHGYVFRVFNQDFVKENLSFIDQQNGDIKSFAVTVGQDNIVIENRIADLKKELGEDKKEQSTGLYKGKYDLEKRLQENQHATKEKNLSEKLTTQAKNIKENRDFNKTTYNKNYLETDIESVNQKQYIKLLALDIQNHKQTIKEEPLSSISSITIPNLSFERLCTDAKNAIEKNIIQTSTIKILSENSSLANWANEGIDLHKDKHGNCAFCGNTIMPERWHKLGEHFNHESKNLRQKILSILEEIKLEEKTISEILNIEKSKFYSKFHNDIEALIDNVKNAKKDYLTELNKLKTQLNSKYDEIFLQNIFNNVINYSGKIQELVTKYNEFVRYSNAHTSTLQEEIKSSQDALRLNAVKEFIDTIDYNALKVEIDTLKQDREKLEQDIQNNDEAITNITQDINDCLKQLSNEAEGAKKVNQYIKHHFGHPELELQPIEINGIKKFKILRNGRDAHNLSEGEGNLIAFCYFLAKLYDYQTVGKKPIIWIDDPISSLDDNHIFFVYSLIRAEIVENENVFEQLFISTHSLNFLKYLKRLAKSKQYYLVDRNDNNNSIIKKMPKYLQEYVTEFNYLFEQIYNTAFTENIDDDNHTVFYNFSNNTRKFFEIYLSFKYPNFKDITQDINNKLKDFFGTDNLSLYLIDRINNEGSHLHGGFERAVQPFCIAEINKAAKAILQKLDEKDSDQVKAFIESIDKDYEDFKQKLSLCVDTPVQENVNVTQRELENAS